jgi:hypothetical protein
LGYVAKTAQGFGSDGVVGLDFFELKKPVAAVLFAVNHSGFFACVCCAAVWADCHFSDKSVSRFQEVYFAKHKQFFCLLFFNDLKKRNYRAINRKI